MWLCPSRANDAFCHHLPATPQVPQKLVSVLFEQPAAVAQHIVQPLALAARCLLLQAAKWGDEAAAGTTSSSQLDMLLQQLQQSSLLQHLAAVMVATARQIWEL